MFALPWEIDQCRTSKCNPMEPIRYILSNGNPNSVLPKVELTETQATILCMLANEYSIPKIRKEVDKERDNFRRILQLLYRDCGINPDETHEIRLPYQLGEWAISAGLVEKQNGTYVLTDRFLVPDSIEQ